MLTYIFYTQSLRKSKDFLHFGGAGKNKEEKFPFCDKVTEGEGGGWYDKFRQGGDDTPGHHKTTKQS